MTEEGGAIPVVVAVVHRTSVIRSLETVGRVISSGQVTLVSRVAAEVRQVLVEPGDWVEKGQILVHLDDANYRLQLERAEAALEAAQADLRRAEKGATEAELEQLRAVVRQAEAAYQAAADNYQRMQRLYEYGGVSLQALDAARVQAETAQAQLDAARQQLAAAEAGASEEILDAAEAQVRAARAQVELARRQLEHCTVRSPVDGVVAQVSCQAGQAVAVGMPLLTVSPRGAVYVRVGVPWQVAASCNPGDGAEVWSPGDEEVIAATVHWIAPVVDPATGIVQLQLELAPDYDLPPGALVKVRLTEEARYDVLTVPLEAVMRDPEGGWYVFVVEDSVARRREVRRGLDDGRVVEVTQGLREGELVVVAGQHYLRDGTRVTVVGR